MAKDGFKSKSVSDEVSDKLDKVIAGYSEKHGVKPPLSVSQMLLIVLTYYAENELPDVKI